MKLNSPGYFISTDKNRVPIEVVHRYLSEESYWAKNIPFDTVKKAVENSLNFCIFQNDELVGYARVISDCATIAYLGDVFILQAHRGKGLSKELMHTIMNHPQLKGLRRWILLTRDAHELYKKFGWQPLNDPSRWMEVHAKDIYQ